MLGLVRRLALVSFGAIWVRLRRGGFCNLGKLGGISLQFWKISVVGALGSFIKHCTFHVRPITIRQPETHLKAHPKNDPKHFLVISKNPLN